MEKEKRIPREKPSYNVKIKVPYDRTPDKEIKAVVYAFDRRGKFLISSPIKDKDNTAQLKLDKGLDPSRVRIFIGPQLPDNAPYKTPTLKMMEWIQAYEPVWKYNPNIEIQEFLSIPENNWKYWFFCLCRIRGQVVRPVASGDITQDMPVCHARVHVCEVDPLILLIPRLPDDIIFRLRDDLLKELRRPPIKIPRPLPDPPPFRFDPSVIDPSPVAIAEMNRTRWSAPKTPSEVLESSTKRFEIAGLGPQPEPPDYPQSMEAIDTQTKARLVSSSATTVRQTLLDNRALLYPYLCLWPWFWHHYHCDEIAMLVTDSQGRFDTTIGYPCAGDHPDLYFWVEYMIGGSWTTVYKPPLPCNVYWNYTCGSEVTLRVLDPRVPWCDELLTFPGKQLAIVTIGNGVSIHEIQDSTAGISEGLTTDGRPFGGSLEPHVWFGEDMIASGITHYRWSYRQVTAGDGATATLDSWHAMDRQVIRHYAVIDPTPPDYPLTFKPYVLGPDPAFPSDNLFQIQPKNPPAGSSGWAPMVEARENTASTFFLSHLLEGGDNIKAAGKYELKLELFNSSGNRINIDDEGVLLKIPTIDAPFGPGEVPTTVASDEYRIKESGKTVAFRMILHVDNNPCEAEIYTISGTGLEVKANCGFVMYSAGTSANVSFKARHPYKFASFNFRIHRGTGIDVPEASADGFVGDSPINGYVRNIASVFSKNIPVTTLLTSHTPSGVEPCTKAAFAETLDVDALVTDGWSHRLWYLDRDATPVAFALEPTD